MDLIMVFVTGLGAFVGLFGWSHRYLTKKLDTFEDELQKKPSEEYMRIIIMDKLEPYAVEYKNLQHRLDELKESHSATERKIEALLDICRQLRYESHRG